MIIKTFGWNIAIKNKNNTKFRILKNNYNSWVADPFVFEKDGKIYIFAEIYEYSKAKGSIGYKVIDGKKESKWKRIISESYHLSFPNIYESNNNIYMCAETSSAKKLYQYKCISFPDVWEIDTILLNDCEFVDTVFFKYEKKNYGLTLDIEKDKKQLLLFSIDNNKITFSKQNPLSNDMASARCGGNVIKRNEKMIRVAQKCDKFYGEALIFSEILSINPYKELNLKTIKVDDIYLNKKKKFLGIHTYNESLNYQVVDLQYRKFEPIRFGIRCINWFLKKINS